MSPEVIVAGGLAVAIVIALGVFALARTSARADREMEQREKLRRALTRDDGSVDLIVVFIGVVALVLLLAFTTTVEVARWATN